MSKEGVLHVQINEFLVDLTLCKIHFLYGDKNA